MRYFPVGPELSRIDATHHRRAGIAGPHDTLQLPFRFQIPNHHASISGPGDEIAVAGKGDAQHRSFLMFESFKSRAIVRAPEVNPSIIAGSRERQIVGREGSRADRL